MNQDIFLQTVQSGAKPHVRVMALSGDTSLVVIDYGNVVACYETSSHDHDNAYYIQYACSMINTDTVRVDVRKDVRKDARVGKNRSRSIH
jgi:hypothetical protein